MDRVERFAVAALGLVAVVVFGRAAGADFLAAGFVAPAVFVLASAAAGFTGGSAAASGTGVGAAACSAASACVAATPIVLESVRWQVSQVTIVRTRPPRRCSSRRRVRGRSQNEQYATSVVTVTLPGRLAMTVTLPIPGRGTLSPESFKSRPERRGKEVF